MVNAYLKIFSSRNLLGLVLITLSAVIIYSNIYGCPFVFDDVPKIQEKIKIRSLSNYMSLGDLLKPRAIVDLTFALNYKFGKLNVFGYHLINVLIHVLNGFLVYFLAHTIFKQVSKSAAQRFVHANRPKSRVQSPKSQIDPKIGCYNIETRKSGAVFDAFQSTINNRQSSIHIMSLVTALLFIAHPIQTQAVTYTVQRCTSMAAMFFLVSVLCYLKARIIAESSKLKTQSSGHYALSAYFGLSIVCGMLAFLSKQNTASLPWVILLVEYLVIDRTWEGWKKKIPWFVLAFSLWTIFVLYVSGFFSGGIEGRGLLEDVSDFMQETEYVSRWSYLCTQFNVLLVYVGLLFLPINQNLDYLYRFNNIFFEGYTPLAFVLLIGIVGIGIWNVRKRPVISLGIFWFFVTLSVESSIIPIKDALVEHRLYLPMFGFALTVTYLIFHFLSKKISWAIAISVVIILSLGTATYLRNEVWRDSVTLWADVVLKSPKNIRGYNNLAFVLDKKGRFEEAIRYYLKALKIKPDFAQAHNNLGGTLKNQGKAKLAIRHYLEALKIRPDYAEAHNNLGAVLMDQGNVPKAIDHYRKSLKIKPAFADAYSNLGIALARQGRLKDAIQSYSRALQINPNLVAAYNGLGIALARQGRLREAVSCFSEALRIDPKNAAVRSNIKRALEILNK